MAVEKVILAAPRGFCAGVEMAVETVERALERHGPPLYVFHEIVHNRHVVEEFTGRGVRFVQSLDEVPMGAKLIFSAHGVSPIVWQQAKEKRLELIIDATCPLVEKVVVLTQTTLSVDDTREVIDVLKQRFPRLMTPPKEDICYATQNRQDAVKQLAKLVDLVLVIGSANSENSNQLCKVARSLGVPAYLINDHRDIEQAWLEGVERVGITSGASAPDSLVHQVARYFEEQGAEVSHAGLVQENVHFALPVEIAPTA